MKLRFVPRSAQCTSAAWQHLTALIVSQFKLLAEPSDEITIEMLLPVSVCF